MSHFKQPLAFRGQTVSKTGSVHEAAETGDLELLQKHCEAGRELGYPDRETLRKKDDMLGATPMHYAAENGHAEVVKWLVDKGVEVTATDSTGVTALHLACIRGNTTVVEFLLNHGCGTETKDGEGDTAMHWAATKGFVAVLELLQKFGAQLDVPNSSGWTPLHRAAYCGGAAACEWLLENNAGLNAVNRDGNTPLHLACQSNQLTCINVLLQWGAKADLPNKDGYAPVDMGSTAGVVKIMEEFAPGTPKRRSAPARSAFAGNSKRWTGYLRKDVAPADKPVVRAPIGRIMEDGFPGAMDSPLRIDKPTIFDEDDPESPSFFSYINAPSPLGPGPMQDMPNEPERSSQLSPLSHQQGGAVSPQVAAVTQSIKRLDVKRSPRASADVKASPRRVPTSSRRATGDVSALSPTPSSRSSRASSVAPWDEQPSKADPITRRTSANQKFLTKYNLDKAKLFSS